MSIPRDAELYKRMKRKVYKKYPQHSAYRSGHLVRQYKDAYDKKYPNDTRGPYIGKKPRKTSGGLARWFAENWKSDTGQYYYSSKNSVYRPTKRVTSKTPLTFSELSSSEIKKAKKMKKTKGRVHRFREKNMA
jgi:hypothetical protein